MNKLVGVLILAVSGIIFPIASLMAQNSGPFSAHDGLLIVRAYTSSFGPDAEEYNRFEAVTPTHVDLDYSDTRGIRAKRRVLAQDMRSGRVYLIGFDPKVALTIPGTTSLGLSSAALQELRATGRTNVSLMYDSKLSTINGTLTVVQKGIKFPVLIENQIVEIAAIRVSGVFQSGSRSGTGDFYFYDDVNQPVLLQYDIRFSWEKTPRTVRTVRVQAGRSQQVAMAKTLATVRKLDIYGIHFDFDKATIQPQSASLIADIATTLKLNPKWTLAVRGHTDSIGKADYNKKLSLQRAELVRQALITKHGIDPGRLEAEGLGASQPKAANTTLQGRAANRRVELARTDR